MARYVALLRGINVGGNNMIKMADLKLCFEDGGFTDVSTYIQSGNVLFTATGAASAIPAEVERILRSSFSHYDASVVIRSKRQLAATVAEAPKGFGADRDAYRYDAIFLKPPLTTAQALKVVTAREGVDEVHPGPGVLYFSRLVSRVTRTHLNKIVGSPIYPNVTIRNWNTTTKLLALLEG